MQKWGQHFLIDTHYIDAIIDASQCSHHSVLEIGPGKGALTQKLIKQVKKLLAVEVDPKLSANLAHRFNTIAIINKDILTVTEEEIACVLGKNWKIIGNLPYFITSPILNAIFSWHTWSSAVLTVQKEVGERICAGPGSKAYGLLSLLTHIHAEAELVCIIPPAAFFPAPEVYSAVIRLTKRKKPLITEDEKEDFLSFLKICFSARRKMLINTLSRGLKLQKSAVIPLLEKVGIEPSQRPETVSFLKYKLLHKSI